MTITTVHISNSNTPYSSFWSNTDNTWISNNSDNASTSNPSIIGSLIIPKDSKAIVIFAHGSGSGRNSPRNQQLANVLNRLGIATLLVDLLTEEEEEEDFETKEFRFNIPLLIDRLVCSIDYINSNRDTNNLKIGIFGASTGAAAALVAAEMRSNIARAIVCRGGRVDLAYEYCDIKEVTFPILLLVGENDPVTVEINEKLLDDLKSVKPDQKKMTIIPGATHLFEEQGKLEQVSRLAGSWFKQYLIDK